MSAGRFENQFNQADANHDGTIDEREFRSFLGPVQNERRLSGNISTQDAKNFAASGASETVTYPIGLDVAVAGFVPNPIDYEKLTGGAAANEGHAYGLGPDVGIGAPNVVRRGSRQYDPAGAMFEYADNNHDGKIDKQEFGSFMRSV